MNVLMTSVDLSPTQDVSIINLGMFANVRQVSSKIRRVNVNLIFHYATAKRTRNATTKEVKISVDARKDFNMKMENVLTSMNVPQANSPAQTILVVSIQLEATLVNVILDIPVQGTNALILLDSEEDGLYQSTENTLIHTQ